MIMFNFIKNNRKYEKFIKQVFTKKIEIPEPSRYPSFNNIVDWMDKKVAYHEYKYSDNMDSLFNPSSGYKFLKIED